MTQHERGGSGARTILLLHGLGATGAVWAGVARAIEARALGQWIAPDLGGHGSSQWQTTYSVGQLAAEIAPLVHDQSDLFIIGHSLGTYLGMALASRWFGVRVAGVLGIGPKVTWSDADIQGMRDLAARPVRWHPQRAEALARYRKVSGLDEAVAPGEELLARGVVAGEQGFRLAQDPRTFMVGGAPFASLVASADARVLLARGEHDAMVSLAELQVHRADARSVRGLGHNLHAQDPNAVIALLDAVIAHG
jgi:pimeloyl-ACP methyl ester carboxylesterase